MEMVLLEKVAYVSHCTDLSMLKSIFGKLNGNAGFINEAVQS
jgi:hypothetical protein